MLSDLLVEDDLSIAVDPDTYQDQVNPAPPLPGNYRLRILGVLKPRKTKAGEVVLTDGKFPTLTIERVKIVEPTDAEREFGMFHDLRTKPFDRFGTVVSDIGDIIRSMDQSRQWRGLQEGLTILEEMVANGTPFAVQGAWSAYDAQYVDDCFSKLGISKGSEKAALADNTITKEAYNAIYKAARLGTNDFGVIAKADGSLTRQHVATGPSGSKLEAKFQIKKFFPSNETVALGPYKLRK